MTEEHEYDLPEGWRQGRIGGVVLKAKQRDPRKAPEAVFQYVDVSGVSNESFRITEATPLKGKDAPSRARKEILEDDVLFATVRPTLKRVALVPKELHGQIASTGYSVLRSDKSKVEPRYLYAHLLTDGFIARMGSLERGAGYPAVRESDVLGSPLPLPPLPEQQRIAQVLSTVQEAIAQQERLIRTTTELKQALMQKLFTEGMHGEALKETEIGLVPESWEVRRLKSLGSTVQSGQTPSRRVPDNYGDEVHWVKTLDLFDDVITATEERLSAKGFKDLGSRLRPVGSVMLAMYGGEGTIGKCGILGVPAASNQAVCAIEPNPSVFNSKWLLHYLIYYRPNWISFAVGTRKDPNIGKAIVENTILPFPKRDEQDEIAATLDKVGDKVMQHKRKHATLQALFRTLLHELMTGKVRVGEKLDSVFSNA